MTIEIDGLAAIARRFDAVLVDQFGVLHDGRDAFPGARAVLEGLRVEGIPVAALTNSGKRATANARRLARFGFSPELFRAVLSSGELARSRLAALTPGTSVLLIARDGETELVDGLDLHTAAPGERADLIVVAAVDPMCSSRADYDRLLASQAARGTPMLLANSDLLIAVGSERDFGPGAVAADYAQRGGPVETLGKPAPMIFEAALAALGNPDPSKTLMIGDSPAHDIEGAAALGMVTLLVRQGVQSDLSGAEADFAIDRLRWR